MFSVIILYQMILHPDFRLKHCLRWNNIFFRENIGILFALKLSLSCLVLSISLFFSLSPSLSLSLSLSPSHSHSCLCLTLSFWVTLYSVFHFLKNISASVRLKICLVYFAKLLEIDVLYKYPVNFSALNISTYHCL